MDKVNQEENQTVAKMEVMVKEKETLVKEIEEQIQVKEIGDQIMEGLVIVEGVKVGLVGQKDIMEMEVVEEVLVEIIEMKVDLLDIEKAEVDEDLEDMMIETMTDQINKMVEVDMIMVDKVDITEVVLEDIIEVFQGIYTVLKLKEGGLIEISKFRLVVPIQDYHNVMLKLSPLLTGKTINVKISMISQDVMMITDR